MFYRKRIIVLYLLHVDSVNFYKMSAGTSGNAEKTKKAPAGLKVNLELPADIL